MHRYEGRVLQLHFHLRGKLIVLELKNSVVDGDGLQSDFNIKGVIGVACENALFPSFIIYCTHQCRVVTIETAHPRSFCVVRTIGWDEVILKRAGVLSENGVVYTKGFKKRHAES